MADGKTNAGTAVAKSALAGGTTTSTAQSSNSATATSMEAAEATKFAIEVGSKVLGVAMIAAGTVVGAASEGTYGAIKGFGSGALRFAIE